MTRLGMTALLSAFLSLFMTTARAEPCSPRLSGVDPYFAEAAIRDCEPFWEGTLSSTGVPGKIVVETGLDLPPDLPDRVLTGLRKADGSIPVLGADVSLGRRVVVMITGVEDVESVAGQIYQRNECYIHFFPTSWATPAALSEIEFTMAHELFHCIQSASLRDLSNVGHTATEYVNQWWVEGTAEWFGHVAVHGTFHRYAGSVEISIDDTSLNHFHDHAWIFFAWLSDRKGLDAIIPYLRTLPEQIHTPEMIVASLTEEDWVDFATTYATFKIRSPDGRTINPPVRAEIELARVDGDTSFDVPRKTGTLMRHKVDVDEGVWQIEADSSDLAFISALDASGDPAGGWRPLNNGPVDIEVPCGEREGFAIVAFNIKDADYSYSASRTGSTCDLSCSSAPSSIDSCLIGTWVMADYPEEYLASRFVRFMEGQVRAAGGQITDIHLPPPVAALFEDGSFTVDHPMSLAGNGTTDGVTFEMKMQFSANQDSGRWGSDGRNLLICPQKNTSSGAMTMVLPGMGSHTIPINSTETIEGEPEGRASYTCSDDVLELTTEANEWFDSMRLSLMRIAGPGDLSSD